VNRALVTAVAEMCATGTSTSKVHRAAEKMGVSRLSKDQVSTIASGLDDKIEELCARPLDGLPVPYVWLDATYVKFRRKGRVASTAVVTAIGCDAGGRGRVLGFDVVDTESYDSWLAFLRKIRDCGAGVEIVLDANLASSERSARHSRAPHGSTAPSTSCAAAARGEHYDEGRTREIDGPVDWARMEAEARKIIESGLELEDRIEAT